ETKTAIRRKTRAPAALAVCPEPVPQREEHEQQHGDAEEVAGERIRVDPAEQFLRGKAYLFAGRVLVVVVPRHLRKPRRLRSSPRVVALLERVDERIKLGVARKPLRECRHAFPRRHRLPLLLSLLGRPLDWRCRFLAHAAFSSSASAAEGDGSGARAPISSSK